MLAKHKLNETFVQPVVRTRMGVRDVEAFLATMTITAIPYVYRIAQHLRPARCGALTNHTIAAMMTSLMANDSQVIPMQELHFSTERSLTSENNANKEPVHIQRTCF